MGVRTGAEFIAGLRDGREVWLGDERVTDVTLPPAFRGAIESLARLSDMQHDPAYRELLTYPSPTTGHPVGLSFLLPRTPEDLMRRRRMIKIWADATCGMMAAAPPLTVPLAGIWRSITAGRVSPHRKKCRSSNSPGIWLGRTLVRAMRCTSCIMQETPAC